MFFFEYIFMLIVQVNISFFIFYRSIKIWDLAQQMSLNSYRGKYSFLIGTGYRYLLFSPLGSLNFVWIIIIASLCSLGWLFLTPNYNQVPSCATCLFLCGFVCVVGFAAFWPHGCLNCCFIAVKHYDQDNL